MDLSDARKLKALEDQNRRPRKLLADSMLDVATLKEMLKNSDAQIATVDCDLGHQGREVLARRGCALGHRLLELAQQRRRFGHRRLYLLLRREGVMLKHKKLYRLYREKR